MHFIWGTYPNLSNCRYKKDVNTRIKQYVKDKDAAKISDKLRDSFKHEAKEWAALSTKEMKIWERTLLQNKTILEKLKEKGASLVDLALAEEKGQELGARRVMECSAKTQVGLKDVFDEAIRVGVRTWPKPPKPKPICALF